MVDVRPVVDVVPPELGVIAPRRASALVALGLLLGCSSPPPAAPDAGLDAAVAADLGLPPGPEVPPPEPLPAVEGVGPFDDLSPDPRVLEVNLTAAPGSLSLRGTTETEVLAYNGAIPGPMLHARVGDRVIVHFHNGLDQPTTVHWHGLRISDQMDGSPRVQDPVPPGGDFTYDFRLPEAGTFWYHAHVNTIEQIARGLYGVFVVHEARPPAFDRERIIALDDVRLTPSGAISPFLHSGPDVGRGRLGNVLLINGRADPWRVEVPRHATERWRIVNTSNARTFVLAFDDGSPLRVIGTDGGLLPVPYETPQLTVAVGQRYELDMRLDDPERSSRTLQALVQVLVREGVVETRPFPLVEAAVVGEVPARPAYVPPEVYLPSLEPSAPESLTWNLSGGLVDAGVEFTINGVAGHHADGGHGHALERVDQGRPVLITLRSMVSPEHPFHLHGQFFQIVAPGGRAQEEPGLKDTVLVQGIQPVTILTYFENPGRWMYHCHISEHAERGMMGEVEVVLRTR